jgi:hypothetical protein
VKNCANFDLQRMIHAMNTRAIGAIIVSLGLSIVACSSSSPISPTSNRPVVAAIPSPGALATSAAEPSPVLPTQRTPDPAPGARLPLPDVQAFIAQASAERPDLIDRLRTLDTRWGYNGKPSRTAADNDGFPVIAAGDEIAYHFGPGSDQGSPDVHLIDVLANHCGPTPALTWRVFTGEEPGFWTGVGRLTTLKKAKRPSAP